MKKNIYTCFVLAVFLLPSFSAGAMERNKKRERQESKKRVIEMEGEAKTSKKDLDFFIASAFDVCHDEIESAIKSENFYLFCKVVRSDIPLEVMEMCEEDLSELKHLKDEYFYMDFSAKGEREAPKKVWNTLKKAFWYITEKNKSAADAFDVIKRAASGELDKDIVDIVLENKFDFAFFEKMERLEEEFEFEPMMDPEKAELLRKKMQAKIDDEECFFKQLQFAAYYYTQKKMNGKLVLKRYDSVRKKLISVTFKGFDDFYKYISTKELLFYLSFSLDQFNLNDVL